MSARASRIYGEASDLRLSLPVYITSFTGDNFDYKKHGYSGRFIKQVIIDIREKKKKRPGSNLILRETWPKLQDREGCSRQNGSRQQNHCEY